MSSLDRLLDTMDDLIEDYNNPTNSIVLKLKAKINLLQIDLDLERQVCKNHEKMLHMYDVRVHELDDKIDAYQTQLEVAHHEIHELQEQLAEEKRKRLMEQWLCDTWEEYLALDSQLVDSEMENQRETKRLRSMFEE